MTHNEKAEMLNGCHAWSQCLDWPVIAADEFSLVQLFEGDCIYKDPGNSYRLINSTDEDVLRRFHAIGENNSWSYQNK